MRIQILKVPTAMLAALAVFANAQADPVGAPINPADVTMSVMIGTQSFTSGTDFTLNWGEVVDKETGRTTYRLWDPVLLTTADGNSLEIRGAAFDPDPVLSFSAAATNNTGSPLAYSFSFNAPMTPALTGAVNSHAELGVTLTDGGVDGATVAPFANPTLLISKDITSSFTSISKGVDIGSTFSVPAGASPSTDTTVFSLDGSLFCSPSCVTMAAQLSFLLTPGGDSVAFTGKVVQTPVPLPGAALLLCSGLTGLLCLGRRRAKGMLNANASSLA
jgi:hypothetical protein